MDQDLRFFFRQWIREPQSIFAGLILLLLPVAHLMIDRCGWLRVFIEGDVEEHSEIEQMHQQGDDQQEQRSQQRVSTPKSIKTLRERKSQSTNHASENDGQQETQRQDTERKRDRVKGDNRETNIRTQENVKILEYYTKMSKIVALLLESMSVSLWMYSSMKISPQIATLLVCAYSILSSIVRVAWNYTENRRNGFERKDILEPVSVYTDILFTSGIEYTRIFIIQAVLYGKILTVLLYDIKKIDGESDMRKYIPAAAISSVVRIVMPSWSSGEWNPFWRHILLDEKFAGHRDPRLYWRLLMSLVAKGIFSQMIFFVLPAIH